MKKRILALLMVLVMLLALLPASGFAEGESASVEAVENVEPSHEINEEIEEEVQEVPTEADNHEVTVESEEVPVEDTNTEPTGNGKDSKESSEAKQEKEPKTDNEIQPVRVEFVCEPVNLTLTVWEKSEKEAETEESPAQPIEPEEDGSYFLMPGEYVYAAECDGYETLREDLVVTEITEQVNVSLTPLTVRKAAPKMLAVTGTNQNYYEVDSFAGLKRAIDEAKKADEPVEIRVFTRDSSSISISSPLEIPTDVSVQFLCDVVIDSDVTVTNNQSIFFAKNIAINGTLINNMFVSANGDITVNGAYCNTTIAGPVGHLNFCGNLIINGVLVNTETVEGYGSVYGYGNSSITVNKNATVSNNGFIATNGTVNDNGGIFSGDPIIRYAEVHDTEEFNQAVASKIDQINVYGDVVINNDIVFDKSFLMESLRIAEGTLTISNGATVTISGMTSIVSMGNTAFIIEAGGKLINNSQQGNWFAGKIDVYGSVINNETFGLNPQAVLTLYSGAVFNNNKQFLMNPDSAVQINNRSTFNQNAYLGAYRSLVNIDEGGTFYMTNNAVNDLREGAKIVGTITNVSATKADFVKRLYEICLGRAPSDADLAASVTELETGTTGTQEAYKFIFSDEFKVKNYCDRHYVEALYEAFMGRSPSESEISNWVWRLQQGDRREDVFNEFALSPEFGAICEEAGIVQGEAIPITGSGTKPGGYCSVSGCTSSKSIVEFATRLYTVCLDRTPGQDEVDAWHYNLVHGDHTGTSASQFFLFSKEFVAKKYSNENYIKHLYDAMMGRNGSYSKDELAYWVWRLESGATREKIFEEFAVTPEFKVVCQNYGVVV